MIEDWLSDNLQFRLVGESRLIGRKVWIIGINYAPDRVGIAPYTAQLAEHLVGRGARVEVTTGIPHYPAYEIASSYRWMLSRRELLNGVPLRRLRHCVPTRMTAARRVMYEVTFLLHALVRRPPFDPDVIIGVTPALSGAVAAARASRRLGAPLLLIVQDLVGPGAVQSGISGGRMISGATVRLEGWALRRASAVTVLHDGFLGYARNAGVRGDRLHVVRNWSYAVPAQTPRSTVRAKLDWPSSQPVILYAGNMGLKMGLSNVVEAARLAHERGDEVLFVLLGAGSQCRRLKSEARGLSTLRFADSRYGSDYADALAAADVLLVNERSSVNNMSLPSKLAYYFTSGRPVLAAVTGAGTTAREIEKAGAGIVVPPEDPKALLEAALALASDEHKCRAMGRSGQRYAAMAYNRGRLLAKVERILSDVISVTTRAGGLG